MTRETLTRDRILRGALAVADTGGLAALTIRSLATELGVKPMAVYHYVANKDEILDGLVDQVFSEIDLPSPEGEWREEISRRMVSARAALRRHPWAIALMESRRTPGPASLSRHEATLATLRQGGFSVVAAAHAYALIDSYVYGFAVQETSLPIGRPEEMGEVAREIMETFEGAYPYMTEIATEHVMQPGYDFGDEFEIGRELVLDALEVLRRRGG
ncbi:TetR/AcrR family transcriptional regulator [Nocardioides sp.]|uniref:TetR/AcrR family transcriptional regulator n=1 Tax=Nocardioides sp. TaxID=35761 RepID=UPI002601481E|nr:TetR/AcrR family transcriptional regulator [Nocardioides sp.]